MDTEVQRDKGRKSERKRNIKSKRDREKEKEREKHMREIQKAREVDNVESEKMLNKDLKVRHVDMRVNILVAGETKRGQRAEPSRVKV